MKHKYYYFLVDCRDNFLPIHFMSDNIKRKWFKRKEVKKGISIYLEKTSLTFLGGFNNFQDDNCEFIMKDKKILDRTITLLLEKIHKYPFSRLQIVILDYSQFKSYTSVLEHYQNTCITIIEENGSATLRHRTQREILESITREIRRLASNNIDCRFSFPSFELVELISKIDNIKRKEDLTIHMLDDNEIVREFASLKLKKLEKLERWR